MSLEELVSTHTSAQLRLLAVGSLIRDKKAKQGSKASPGARRKTLQELKRMSPEYYEKYLREGM